ncbi:MULTISPECIES: fluoride efflux transporter FluC [unclassified Nocardioides]|uniref:fluoride efflux transporter FluC n=1 Tax=Nocardioides sp. URHA0032 TaxID=1380388 RepID=UPI000687AD7E|nr:CrcB family protein [Nocardioides sp. URHA0032]
MSDGPTPRLLAAVAVGGALGALARWGLTQAFPASADEFPWATFGINVAGSFVLALLPAFVLVRRHRELAVGLGPGVLGGFTTLSAYSEQTRALLDAERTGVALAYLLGTLATCLVAVAVADHWSTLADRRTFEEEGGDE